MSTSGCFSENAAILDRLLSQSPKGLITKKLVSFEGPMIDGAAVRPARAGARSAGTGIIKNRGMSRFAVHSRQRVRAVCLM